MTQALIAILQDTIKTGDGAEFATLREERRIVDKYVIIQQTRYPDRFCIEWQAEEQLWDSQVPRMLLQPLVENAILHGLFPSDREDGQITIRAYESDNQMILEVEDNGVGMDENNNEEIRHLSLSGPERTRGIGLGNIRERIQFHYGSPYGVEIDRPDGQGTLIRIRLPLKSHE
jgi:two-component system sensor histidine kinase YesM